MTIGIYALHFTGTTGVYIGKSINIEQRYLSHLYNLRCNMSSRKLQKAYLEYGEPSYSIILECKESELIDAEVDAISIYDSIKNGFNTSAGGETGSNLVGDSNGMSSISNDTAYKILLLLINTNNSISNIALETDTTISIVQHISSLSSHKWLKEVYPEEYLILENIKANGSRYAISKSNNRPNSLIMSPTGDIIEVLSIKEFCTKHGLKSSSCVSQVLSGVKPTYNGWSLPSYKKPIDFYPPILSPEGTRYTIPFRGAAKFAKEHGLDASALRHVLHGHKDYKSHKGWKLCT